MEKQNISPSSYTIKKLLMFMVLGIVLLIIFCSYYPLKLKSEHKFLSSWQVNYAKNNQNQQKSTFHETKQLRYLQINDISGKEALNIKIPSNDPVISSQAMEKIFRFINQKPINSMQLSLQILKDVTDSSAIETVTQNIPNEVSNENFKKQTSVQLKSTHQLAAIQIRGITGDQLQLAKSLLNSENKDNYRDLIQKEKLYYQQKYSVSSFKEQPFCIVIPSYNNMANNRYLHNLNSILQQDYSNYHIILIDDASDDGTAEAVLKFAKNYQISEQKLKIIVNEKRRMAMYNIHRAAHQFCKSHEIFMIVDGDDYLIGTQVLKLYNSLFQSKDYWLIYTNYMTQNEQIGYSNHYAPFIIENGLFRKAGFAISHLRAFYTKLFTLIKQEDLKDQHGNWFRAANDIAMYISILEMARQKFSYIPQLCYLYNSNTGLNNYFVKQKEQQLNQIKIKSRDPYSLVKNLFTPKQKQELKNSLDQKIGINNFQDKTKLQKQKGRQ